MEERLQKILAQAGFGSRRSCEELITAQRVRVNGKIATLGSKADVEEDHISVDGQVIPKIAAHMYIALNKPKDVLSDIDPEDPRQTVHDLVRVPGHLFAVGRLDYDSEGLILLTNDGELANRLTHPRYGHEKEYHVLVANRPDDEQLAAWRRGIVLADGYQTRPAEVFIDRLEGKGAWLRVVLREGRKRQIREVGSRIGLPVLRILRVRIGTLLLGDLHVGAWRHLTADEVRRLRASVEKPVRNPLARAGYGGNRPTRGSGGGETRSERRPFPERRGDGERSEKRSEQGDRSEWKPTGRAAPGPFRPNTGGDRPLRKTVTWPRREDSSDRSRAEQPGNSGPDTERGSRRPWQKPGAPTGHRPDQTPPDADQRPRRTWQKPGSSAGNGPQTPASDTDRKPRTWQKRQGNPAEHNSGGRPPSRSNRPNNRPGGRTGGRPKGPRTPRG